MELVYKLDRISLEPTPTFWDRRRKRKTIKKLNDTNEEIAYLTAWLELWDCFTNQDNKFRTIRIDRIADNRGKLATLNLRKEALEKELKAMEWIK